MSQSSSREPQQQQYEVQLAIYDLSQGMARQLSSQFLGPDHAINLVPHTGIRVYGNEYYFGGGIQCASNPLQFQASTGLMPVQVQSLGYTTTDRATFEAWCVQEQQYPQGRFTVTSYDLLHRNCNHFCHEAALQGLNLSQGVPHWILDVPHRFLSSPMGQLIRPILEQMQITSSSSSPVATSSSTQVINNATNTWGVDTSSSPAAALNNMPTVVARASTNTLSNPWAPPPAVSAPTIQSKTQQNDPGQATPVLDLFHKPLVSKDTRSIPVILRKLSSIISSNHQDDDDDNGGVKALSNLGSLIERSLSATTKTTTTTSNTTTTTTNSTPEVESSLSLSLSIERGLTELHRILVIAESSNLAFSLMLLRLVVLVIPTKETTSLSSSSLSLSPSPMLQSILEWMEHQLISATDDDNETPSNQDDDVDGEDGAVATGNGDGSGALDKNPAARSMAWCVSSNLISVIVDMPPSLSNTNHQEALLMDKQGLIDSAIRDMTASNCQVRQAATCFLYNLALAKTNWTVRFQQQLEQEQQSSNHHSQNNRYDKIDNDGILLQDDLLLSILCACVEEFSLLQLLTTSSEAGKEDQYDPMTCLRRLAVIGRILVPVVTTRNNADTDTTLTNNIFGRERCNTAVRQFLLDLGLDQFLKDHVAVAKTPNGTDSKKEKDASQCRELATELYRLLL